MITETQPATSLPTSSPSAANAPLGVDCPECAASVDLGTRPMVHEILPCADCGAELEVLALDPLTVDLAPEVEEDWGE